MSNKKPHISFIHGPQGPDYAKRPKVFEYIYSLISGASCPVKTGDAHERLTRRISQTKHPALTR